MHRVLACLAATVVFASAPVTLMAQVCEGTPGPLGAVAVGVGYNALNGHSGTDFSGRLHIEYGSATLSWISRAIFPEVQSGALENPSGHAYSITSRPASGQLGLNLALHHRAAAWACFRTGVERAHWEQEIRLLDPTQIVPGSDEEALLSPGWVFGSVTTIPVGVSLGQSFALTEGIVLVPFGTARYVTFREEFGVETETRYDWDGTFGVSAGLGHLLVTGTVSRYFRHSGAPSHVRFAVAYPFGGAR